jgi:hypothetical protein
MATEVLNDIRSALGLTIDLSSFLFFPNIRELVTYVDEKLGVSGGDEEGDLTDTPSSFNMDPVGNSSPDTKSGTATPESMSSIDELKTANLRPTITSAVVAFRETRFSYDQLAETTQAVGLWETHTPTRLDWSWPTSWKHSPPWGVT